VRCETCSKGIVNSLVNPRHGWLTTAVGAKRLFNNKVMCGNCANEEPVVGLDSLGLPLLAGNLGITYP
jgi:hypothetical protein